MPIRPVSDPSIIAQLNAGGGVQNPMFPAQQQKAQNEGRASEYAPAKAASDVRIGELTERIKAAEANTAAATSAAERDKAVADANKAQIELEKMKLGAQLDPEKRKAIETLQLQLDHVRELWQGNIKGGMPNPIFGHLPTGTNKGFDSASQGLVSPFQSAFRVPGVGAQSDTELKQFQQGGVPNATDTDQEIAEKIGNLQRRIDTELGAPAKSNALPPITGDNQDAVGFASGKTRSVIDPALKATGQRVGRMIADGVSDEKITAFLKRSGVDPKITNVDQALQFRQGNDFKAWKRANPGKAYPIGSDFYTKAVPMSGLRDTVNRAAQSDVGGSAMAAGAGMANTIMGDRLGSAVGALTGEPGTAETGMQMLAANHPVADLAGNIAGQATLEGMTAGIPGANALLASKWGRRGADGLFGAYYGSGDNSSDGATGAAGGAVTNALGGMAGRGLQHGLGSAITGVQNENLKYLNDAKTPLTIGQIGNGTNSVVGKAIGGIEDRAAGVPIFDAIINSARRRGEEGFNSAAFRQAGGSGATGAHGVEELHNNVANAYSFLDPVSLPLDAQFAGTNAGIRASLPTLPKYGKEIGANLNTIDAASNNGALAGRDWQQALRITKGDKASLRGKEFSTQAIDTLDDAENNLLGLASRQSPDNLKGSLAKANDLNKQFRTITSALDNGPSQARGELFSTSRLDAASRASQRKFGGQVSSMEGNRPFYDLTKAGMDVMPNQVPDSGTAGRSLLYSALFGGGVGGGIGAAGADDGQRGEGGLSGAGKGLALSAALAAPYSKTGQKVIQKALLGDRSDRVVKIGNYLINRDWLASLLGSGVARQEVYQPGLPQ